jgi:hypothetical protein
MKSIDRALLILTSHDFESLQLTLKAVEKTCARNEIIVIILNGTNSLSSSLVERMSRAWAEESPINRFVVRPLCSGSNAYFAIREILESYNPLFDIKYICKIDDDIIPLKVNWLDNLAANYREISKKTSISFITGLINNNCWGFKQLIDVFDKKDEYSRMFNYKTHGGPSSSGIMEVGEIDTGNFGTIWKYPFISWWVHQWTSLQIPIFIEKTKGLLTKEISVNTNYSIGCIYFEKSFWLTLEPDKYGSYLDEKLIHHATLEQGKTKWAVMNEPFIHLFYFNQRLANRDILEPLKTSLKNHFGDPSFEYVRKASVEELLISLNEKFRSLHDDMISILENIVVDN